MARILLIDDDAGFAEILGELLAEECHDVRWLDSAEEALKLLAAGERFHLVLLDNKMPRMGGLEFLAGLTKRGIRAFVVLLTSSHSDHTAIQAVNLGASDYVIKPSDFQQLLPELEQIIRKALEVVVPPTVTMPTPEDRPEEESDESVLVGRSKPMLALFKRIGKLAGMDETVLIGGETGTGKDLVARALHTNSHRKDRPFVALNCGAFHESLLDDELFGHEIGAFTGAVKLRKGRFEYAAGGTLFLDEVGDMPLPLQVKLLRVLENREIVRLGGNEPIRIDVRVLAATHLNLAALEREGKFRRDLFFRLDGLRVDLPPLRERAEDIEHLTRTFLARLFPDRAARPVPHPQTLALLRGHPWPGNVRQLQKVLCRAAGNCRGQQILPEDIDFGEGPDRTAFLTAARDEPLPAPPPSPAPAETAPQDPLATLRGVVEAAWHSGQPNLWPSLQERLERELLAFALSQPGVSQVKLADRLGVCRNYLRKRLKDLGLGESDRG